MRLKPFENEDESEVESAIGAAVQEALQTVGLKRGKNSKLDIDEIREIFSNKGAGIEEVAEVTSSLMRSADKEETRLRASEMALRVQGVFKDLDEKPMPVINITVQGSGNKTLISLVCP